MSNRIPERTRLRYMELRRNKWSVSAAARDCGISRTSAYAIERGLTTHEDREQAVAADSEIPAPRSFEELPEHAQRAFEDFAFFRQYYLARDDDTPWQEEAAQEVLAYLETPEKEFVVMNMPPGTGKTTLFTHDIPCWLIIRDRTIRILLGSHVGGVAKSYARRLKNTLERETPYVTEDGEEAQGVICRDFGRFKPLQKDLWSTEEFVVEQLGGQTSIQKEATVKAVGEDGGFLGGRFTVSIWDDLVTMKNNRYEERRADQQGWWKREAETRCEPGGAVFLVGQRLLAEDLYRFNLERLAGLAPEEGEEDTRQRKYHHIIFKAHDEENCRVEQDPTVHDLDAPAWPDGCLLSPRRVTWRELASIKSEDPATFATVYQQEDAHEGSRLVQEIWLAGGVDPDTGMRLPGCYEKDWHGNSLLPEMHGLQLISVMTVDPSPTKWWGVHWYLHDAPGETTWLMNLERRKMDAPDFLDRVGAGTYIGLADEWVRRSHELGQPIRYLIMEKNAAQRFMLQYRFVQDWLRKWGIILLDHSTGQNKADPDYGVQTVGTDFRFGRIRLPWGVPYGRKISQPLTKELLTWPNGATDDQVMSHWFYKLNLPNLKFQYMTPPTQQRPSWLRAGRHFR